jgi:hypothetical protein
MDAPPPMENCGPYVRVAKLLADAGVHAPEVHAADLERGFLLLSDLGARTYLDALDASSAPALYADAIDTLLLWQSATREDALRSYDEALLMHELALFPDWYVQKHLGRTLSSAQAQTLADAFRLIERHATNGENAIVFVHGLDGDPIGTFRPGDTAPDWLVKDGHHEQLRAERSGLGNGRTYTTTVTCSDGAGHTASKRADVNVSHDIDGPARGSMFAAGATVSFTGHFRDSVQSPCRAEWLFDSIRKPALIVADDDPNPSRVMASTSFPSFGVYRMQLNVTDASGQTGSTSMVGGLDANIVVYPSSGEYAAGAGWIDSPAGACVANRSLKGKGSFGFVSRSAHSATKGAAGETEFDLHLPGFRFNALNFESQTVSGAKAQFRGTGTVNGAGSYGFVLTTTDGDQIGGVPDTFRIRIWNKSTGATVYDNEMGSPDTADPATPVGSGSSIVIAR